MSFLLPAALLVALAAPARADDAAFAQVVKVWGDEVSVRLHESTSPIDAQVGLELEPGDVLRTGEASGAEILVSSSSLVSVAESSVFRLDPGAAVGESLRLDVGAVLLKWRTGPSAALKVRTPNAVAAVRGTEFGLSVPDNDSPTTVGVFDEGKVAASTDAGEVLLGPNSETTCAPGKPPSAPRPLKAMLKYRATMRAMRARLAQLQRDLRRLPSEKQRELRRSVRSKGRRP